jgi:hypothetical protein
MVFYVVPLFDDAGRMARFYRGGEIIRHSVGFTPTQIGEVAPSPSHKVSFRHDGRDLQVHSDPKPARDGTMIDEALGSAPSARLDAEFISELRYDLLSSIEAAEVESEDELVDRVQKNPGKAHQFSHEAIGPERLEADVHETVSLLVREFHLAWLVY